MKHLATEHLDDVLQNFDCMFVHVGIVEVIEFTNSDHGLLWQMFDKSEVAI